MLKPNSQIVLSKDFELSKSFLDFPYSMLTNFHEVIEKTKILRKKDKLKLGKFFKRNIALYLIDGPTFVFVSEEYAKIVKNSIKEVIQQRKAELVLLDYFKTDSLVSKEEAIPFNSEKYFPKSIEDVENVKDFWEIGGPERQKWNILRKSSIDNLFIFERRLILPVEKIEFSFKLPYKVFEEMSYKIVKE